MSETLSNTIPKTKISTNPNTDTIHKPVRFLLLGRSGSGKSSIAVNPVISYTTRPQRNLNDTDHYFIKPSQVNDYPHKIAYTKIGAYEYFATREELNHSLCYIIDYNGLQTLYAPEYEWISVYIHVDPNTQISRLTKRGDTIKIIKSRLNAENDQFTRLEQNQDFDYILDNSELLEDAQEQFFRIIQFESNYPTNQERYYFQRKYFQYLGPGTLTESQKHWGYAYRTFSGGFATLVAQKTGEYWYKIISPENALSKQVSEAEYHQLISQYNQTATPILITDLWNGQKGISAS